MTRQTQLTGFLAILTLVFLTSWTSAQPPQKGGPKSGKAGVSINDAKAYQGYTLVAPMNSKKAYLVNMEGRIVNTWDTDCTPGLSTYLLENGNLLRAGNGGAFGGMAGAGGRVQEFTFDGKLVWDYKFSGKNQQPHHDITRLPNGNVLMIVGEKKTADQAIAVGRRPESVSAGHINADCLIEVRPTGKTTGEIVWEWHLWDHLVQDHDKTKANFNKISSHPELVDINYGQGLFGKAVAKKDDLDKLRGLGYLGGPGGPGGGGGFNPGADWTHTNAVAYNADLDQIVISVHNFSEIWIIDHSTSKSESAGHTGGKYGKGGDLLYRWGNPQAYRSGTNVDQRLFGQHNAHWIPKGYPGEGNMIVFNNGAQRPDGRYSSVDEIVLPVDKSGKYSRKPGLSFGPEKAKWTYTAEKKADFYAMAISGAHRLPNGNTLICSGPDGTVFEVTPESKIVWKFGTPSQGGGMKGGPGFGFRPPPQPPGQILPTFFQDQMKFSDEQKKQVEALQKEVDAKLEAIMTTEQKKQFKDMANAKGGPGFGGMGGMPGPGGLFRSYRYGADYPGLAGRTLTAGKMLAD